MKKFLTAIVAFGMVCFSTIVAGAVEQLPPVKNEVRRYAVRIDGTYVEYNYSLLERKIELQELAQADTEEIERNEALIDRLRKAATAYEQ